MRAATIFLCLAGSALAQDTSGLVLKARIPLAHVEGRIDHFSADVQGHIVFMSALGNHTLEVLDVQASRVRNTIPGLAEPQGVLYEPSTKRLFVASRADGTTKVFDAATFQLLTTVKFSNDADNVRYDVRANQIDVGYGDGAIGILDTNGRKIREIGLDAHPESFQLERNGGRMFVNVPDRKEIQVVDTQKHAVLARWPVTSASDNYPMALDEAHHRLLVGCRTPARLLVIDTESGKLVTSVEIVDDTDDLFYDGARGRAYVIGGGGFVDVIQQRDPDHYQRIEHLQTAPGTRTGLFVPEWNQLFLAVPHRGAQAAEVRIYEARDAR